MSWNKYPRGPRSSSVFRNMMTLLAGGTIAKAIGFAAMPVITRIYAPEDLGTLGTFTALVALIAPLATLRYATVLPIPRKDSTAANLLVLNLALLLVSTIVLTIVALLIGTQLMAKMSLGSLAPYLALVVAGVFCTALYEILTSWGTRKRAFRMLAISQASQSLLANIIKIGLGLCGAKSSALLMGQIVQQGGGGLALVRMCSRQVTAHRRRITVRRVATMGRLFLDAPKFRLPSQLLLMGAMQGPILLSAQLFGLEATGQLGLALSTLAVPLNLLGTTTGNAYFAEISALGRNNAARILEITRSVTRRLFLFSCAPTLILVIAGPWLFSIVFGAHWEPAGQLARILAVYLTFQFISSPLGNALTLFRRQDLLLKMNLARFIITVSIFITAGMLNWALDSTMLAYSGFLTAHYVSSNRIILGVIRRHATASSVS